MIGAAWYALAVTSILALLAAALGLVLYRFSEGRIEQKGIRLSGAAAIALVMYVAMTKFYLDAQDSLLLIAPVIDPVSFENMVREFDTCVEHEVNFQCRIPALNIRNACVTVLSQ